MWCILKRYNLQTEFFKEKELGLNKKYICKTFILEVFCTSKKQISSESIPYVVVFSSVFLMVSFLNLWCWKIDYESKSKFNII